ncbi:MAG: hypothetical protein RMJ17_02420 [Candidatus Aenigmarchaeota archaeon]|nr:hypothetical protein [Candidatus Aenigmarchaeota archaeon]MDW8149427.1 hypothetical protein [Candidatus Aenigmarchaeota archaeon]
MKSLSPILEVVIAFFSILFIVTLSISFLRLEKNNLEVRIKLLIYETIDTLIKTKNLRKYIVEGNETEIEKLLLEILPAGMEIEVDILNLTAIYQKEIPSKNVIATPFIIGGDYNNYVIKKLIVFVKLP